MKFYTCLCFSTVLMSCILSHSLVNSAVGDIISKFPKQGWQTFQWLHVLNPDKDMAYSLWNAKTWRQWLFKRNPALKETFRQRREGQNEIDNPIRYSEVVIVAKPEEVLEAFSGELIEVNFELIVYL
ncbi:unnamed protein product [Allacma fusca]|uniref:Uncharacterized protein n=1 Tax=Allacma fusca TaxID=39272 RepID=A0A8J2KJZ9_9HEXA|nr:unnamed protein product [Allacma fusca]